MGQDHRDEAERLLATLGRYLSDEIAPMIFLDSADVLLSAPPEVVAAGIRGWISSQVAGSGRTTVADLLFHAAKKIHLLAELELVPAVQMASLLDGLRPHLLEVCPEAYRRALANDLERLGAAEIVMAARPDVLHRPLRGDPDPSDTPESRMSGRPGAAAPVPGGAAAADYSAAMAQGLGRLTLLLDRLALVPGSTGGAGRIEPVARGGTGRPAVAADSGLADAATPPSGTKAPSVPGGGLVTRDLLAEVLAEVARTARTGAELETQLGMLRSLGVQELGASPLRALAQTLPDWAPGRGQASPFGAVQAMEQIVGLSREHDAGHGRFSELVTTAVEEFNSGSLGRAVTLLDLAQRMVEKRTVDATVFKSVVGQAYPILDPARLRVTAEAEEQHQLLRRVMSFFPQLGPEELLGELEVEDKRDRRRTLIALLTVHGDRARAAALATLRDGMAGTRRLPWHFERNLVYLLRSVPRHDELDLATELDVLVHVSELSAPLPLVREALSALGQLRHERADVALAARVSELEDALLGTKQVPHSADDLLGLLDSAIALMARSPSRTARRSVANHGMKRRPQLGDTSSRLARLGSQDLSDDPELVERLVGALRDELPTKVLGIAVTTPRRAKHITSLIEALAGTDVPPVRQVLSQIASQYAGQPFAEPAGRALAHLGSAPEPEGRPTASLSGDLQLFGLPNLLQNLADSQLSGVLTLFDPGGAAAASVTIVRGQLSDATAGSLRRETAVYQLLERPAPGRFVFVNRGDEAPPSGDEGPLDSVTSVLLEGMRRYDELQRASALVPAEARFRATGRRPGAVSNERDPDLVREVWRMAAGGSSPVEVEAQAKVDSYRVRQLFERWLVEGALEPAD